MTLTEQLESQLNEAIIQEGIFDIKPQTLLQLVTVEDSTLNNYMERAFSIYGGSMGRFTIDGKLVHAMAKNAKAKKHFAEVVDRLSNSMSRDDAADKVAKDIVVSFVTAQELWNKVKGSRIDTSAASPKMWDFILKMRAKDSGEDVGE